MATTLTREASWNKVGTSIREANSVKEALQIAGLDYEVVNTLIGYEKNLVTKDKRTAMQDIIDSILKADKNNY